MKIIVPLAGEDTDFIEEFSKSKVLCQIGNISILEFFVHNFLKQFEYIFILNLKDMLNSEILDILDKVKVRKKIILSKNKTSNAIETVLLADKLLKNNDSIIVAHPDGLNNFSKNLFLKEAKKNEGVIFGLNDDNQTNTSNSHLGRVEIDKQNFVKKVLEKSLKTKENKTLSGLYYFKTWKNFKAQSKLVFKNQKPINGRFFVSQIYNEYIRKGLKVKFFTVKKFIDFGTPSLLNEFNFWNTYFKKNYKKKLTKKFNFINLVPSCGEGKRFLRENKNSFKPLIEIDYNKSLVKKTVDSLPISKKNIIIIRDDHNKKYDFQNKLKCIKNSEVVILNKPTDGMARTCYNYLKDKKIKTPILMSSCDYSFIFDEKKLKNFIKFIDPDVMIWSYRGYPDPRLNPYAYAYLEMNENGLINNISEKTPISDQPHKDLIAQGIFYFKNKEIFMTAAEHMFKTKNMINGEYYVGNSINYLISKKYKVVPFEVDQYICLGTPEDFRIYSFWKKFFNKKDK